MKILMLFSRIPYPLIKGDKLRAYHHIKELSKKHQIVLCALTDEKVHPEAIPELSKYCSEIHVLKLGNFGILFNLIRAFFLGLPMQSGYFFNSRNKKMLQAIIAKSQPDHIFCQLIRVAEYVKGVKNIPMTLDYQDVFSKGIERRMQVAPFFMKPLFGMEFRRLLKYEYEVFDRFANKIIISEPDRNFIPHPRKDEIEIVPNGVDTHYFSPREAEAQYDLLFTGNMAYPPNINAATYIVKEVMPLLLREKPEIKLLIAGANPVKSLIRLQSKNVHISGWVRDIRSCYAQSKIFFAPMQIGTGLQNKLLEAMSMKLPCVSSELANSALNAQHEKEIFVGKSTEDYVGYIIKLLDDRELRDTVATNGHHFVLTHFKWEALTERISKIITQV